MKKILDGIVDDSKYGKDNQFKIMWILKEGNVSPNDIDKDRDICEEFRNNRHKNIALSVPTFRKIIYATYGILYPEIEWSEVPFANAEAYDAIKYISYININKFPGGKVSNYYDIKQAYDNNKEDLLNQIKKCDPNIIIFGNTLQFFETDDMAKIKWNISESIKKYADESTFNTAYYITSCNRLCINAYHPSYPRIKDEVYWNEIRLVVQKWKETNS